MKYLLILILLLTGCIESSEQTTSNENPGYINQDVSNLEEDRPALFRMTGTRPSDSCGLEIFAFTEEFNGRGQFYFVESLGDGLYDYNTSLQIDIPTDLVSSERYKVDTSKINTPQFPSNTSTFEFELSVTDTQNNQVYPGKLTLFISEYALDNVPLVANPILTNPKFQIDIDLPGKTCVLKAGLVLSFI